VIAVICSNQEEFEQWCATHKHAPAERVSCADDLLGKEYDGVVTAGTYYNIQGWTRLKSHIETLALKRLPLLPAERLKTNIVFLLKQICMGDGPAPCRGCGRQVYMVRHRNGKVGPYTDEANLHFRDCPAAKEFSHKERL